MDAIEGPLMRRIQMELDKVDVEKLIDDNISGIEARVKNVMDSSKITILGEPKVRTDEDEYLRPSSESDTEHSHK